MGVVGGMFVWGFWLGGWGGGLGFDYPGFSIYCVSEWNGPVLICALPMLP